MPEYRATSTSSSLAPTTRAGGSWRALCFRSAITLLLAAAAPLAHAGRKPRKPEPVVPDPPPLVLAGGRSLSFDRSFSSEREVRLKKAFWTRVFDLVAGAPVMHDMVRPYGVATDSKGRIIVTDPGASGVHVFDFAQQKYKFLSHHGKDAMVSPQCVAIDAADSIYVTDSEAGRIFVWDHDGKFQRSIGSLRGGEGRFKRPTGIAVDSATQRIYVTDTFRHKIFELDMNGDVVQTIGKPGAGEGEFNFPTELRLQGGQLLVVDAMNFRVQTFDREGQFLRSFGQAGETTGSLFRPKGVALDHEGDIYLVDGLFDTVQVFNPQGQLLYYFGRTGDGPAEFQLPAGLSIEHTGDRTDKVYVVDSYNRRVQVFRYSGALATAQAAGGIQ